jgi:hypothetical protein
LIAPEIALGDFLLRSQKSCMWFMIVHRQRAA